LKNIIDWASRTENGGPSREAFQGKTFVIMSASPGPGGGARGLAHLRSIIENIGGTVLTEQISVPSGFTAFDEQGHLKDPALNTKLQQTIQEALKKGKQP
jgi:NAD(P)H-dependent FMN reductase